MFFVTVEGGDLLHVGLRQGEVEDVEVVAEVLRAGAARHGDDAALQVPAQDDLRRALAVSLRDALDVRFAGQCPRMRTAAGLCREAGRGRVVSESLSIAAGGLRPPGGYQASTAMPRLRMASTLRVS